MLLDAYTEERKTLLSWTQGFPDRDHKFVREFQTTFNTCFWELYLHALFRDFGFDFNWNHASPDFFLNNLGQGFIVEATTANAAQGQPNEWDADISSDGLRKIQVSAINKEATIRLSNAIFSKSSKYLNSYHKLPHVSGKPFVIAVAPFEQPFFNLQHDRPIRSLLYDYYIDEEEYQRAPELYPYGPPGIKLGTIEKSNGAEINLGFFNDNTLEHVSAVIFSCLATMGKLDALSAKGIGETIFNSTRLNASGIRPHVNAGVMKADYRESLQDGLQIYHNPFAKYPLSKEHFRKAGVVQHFLNHESGEWIYEGVDNALTWRNSFKIIPKKETENTGN